MEWALETRQANQSAVEFLQFSSFFQGAVSTPISQGPCGRDWPTVKQQGDAAGDVSYRHPAVPKADATLL